MRIPRKLKKYRKDTWCENCDICETQRSLVYEITNGMMSYPNYTLQAILEVYKEQQEKLIGSILKDKLQEILESKDKEQTIKQMLEDLV